MKKRLRIRAYCRFAHADTKLSQQQHRRTYDSAERPCNGLLADCPTNFFFLSRYHLSYCNDVLMMIWLRFIAWLRSAGDFGWNYLLEIGMPTIRPTSIYPRLRILWFVDSSAVPRRVIEINDDSKQCTPNNLFNSPTNSWFPQQLNHPTINFIQFPIRIDQFCRLLWILGSI